MADIPGYQDANIESNAQSQVNGPGIGLIVTAGLGIVAQICAILMNILGVGLGAAAAQHDSEATMNMISGGVGIVFGIVGIIVGVVILIGAMKMRNLKSHGFAMTAAILAMLPCISPCCLLGLPFGIWALVVLLKPEVKAAFSA